MKELCKVKGMDYLVPKIICETRWNTVYFMLERLKTMENIINNLALTDNELKKKILSF